MYTNGKTIQDWVEKIKQSRGSLTASTLKAYQTRLKKLLMVNEKKDPLFLKNYWIQNEGN